jgi:hypothetical protein
MKKFLFFFLFLSLIVGANTATALSGSISGKVSDEYGKPLSFVSVLLLQARDSGMVKTELTNEKGEFDLTLLASGEYFLKATLLGYETYTSAQITVNDSAISFPDIKLQSSDTKLNEVTVSAQKPFIEVHPDKLVVNVDNSIVSAGSSVMEILQRSPGVTVDDNDNISLKGKQGVNIMIDGRAVPIPAADLANMLKSMPAASIEKIEIISNPSAKYDAAGTAGIIDILTKKDKGMGWNGSINGSYGQGIYPKENAGFNLNYREKKLNVYVNYNANYREGFSHVDWNRSFYTNGVFNGAYIQDNYSVLTFHTNTAAAGLDYNFTSKTTMGFSVTGQNYHLGTTGYYYAHVYDQNDQPQSDFATNNTSAGNWNNYAPNLHLLHKFDSSGEQLTVDADYARYWNANTQDFTTHYYALNGTEFLPPYMLHGDINGVTQIRSLKIDYTEPLKNNAHVDAGFKTSYVTADNQPSFYNRSNGGNIFDSTKSDHFIYNEGITALYINAVKDWKKWSAQAGLRAEQTTVYGNEEVTAQTFSNSYLKLFPSVAVQDHVNANNDIGATMSRRIERPGYDDLNPYKFFVDPSTYKEGNPYLNPALTWSAELSHTYKQRLVTSVSYSQTSNVITEVILPSTTQDRVTIQTKKNLAQMTYYGLSGSYTIPVYKWWNSITNFNAYYGMYTGDLANTYLNAGKPTFDVYTSNKFTLPKDWSAEASFFYQAAQVYGFLNLTPISMLNAGVQKNLYDKHLTLKVSANDVFWHGNESGSSYFTGYTQVFVAKHDTRQVTMSVVYRFGKKTVTPIRKHSGGAEEEKKRAGDQTG